MSDYIETDAEVLEREEVAAIEDERRKNEQAANPLAAYTVDELLQRQHSIGYNLSTALAERDDEHAFAFRSAAQPRRTHLLHLQERVDALTTKRDECEAELQRRTNEGTNR